MKRLLCILLAVIMAVTPVYASNGEKLGNGKDRVRGILCENPALCAELEAKIKECFVKKPDGFGDADADNELSFSDELE